MPKIHPIADLLPMLSGEEWETFKADIDKNGVRLAVVVHEGQIIDGRNRWKACEELGLKCPTREWDGKGSILDYIVSCNLERRHLNASQRAAFAAEAMPFYEAEAKKREKLGRAKLPDPKEEGRARDHAAKAFKASPRYTEDAKKLKAEAPAIFEQVKAGKQTISQAKKDLRKQTRARELKAKIEAVPRDDVKVDLRMGDFRELIKELPDASIDLILTDPPYPKEYLELWKPLAQEAARVLKPGKFLIAYSGNNYLMEVLDALRSSLDYYWLGTLYHRGNVAQRFETRFFNRGKPILFFQKPPREKQAGWLDDVLVSEEADKDSHEWGQSAGPVKKIIEAFTAPGETILDPMFGGGTTIFASLELKRNVIGFEIDKPAFDKCKGIL